MRKAEVKMYDRPAGYVWRDEEGYHFQYIADYLLGKNPEPVSIMLPLQQDAFHNQTVFPFFDGPVMPICI